MGPVVSSNMSWSSNTEHMVCRANKKLSILRRLKRLGPTTENLLDLYIKQVKSMMEFAVPVRHSSITGEQRLEIERIQKSAFHIILGDH